MPSRLPACVLGAAFAIVSAGCAHVQTVGHLGEKLEKVPDGYVSGEIVSLDRRALLDNKDFIYSIAIDPSASHAAYTHLAGKTFNLAIWKFEDEKKPQKLADVATNDYQFDLEGLDYSPDGKVIATAGRDGAIRIFDAQDGHAVNVFFAEEPLVSIAFLPDGKHLVAGSARGLLLLLNWPDLPSGQAK